jgi:glycosyltransferase involved in cell wall biosynthesis
MPLTVTVAICTWNRSDALRLTLEQFTKMRVPQGIEWELLVVNNNCTDDTDEIVAAFNGRLPVRLLHERTPGQSHARNLAIRESRGTYLAWTDDDVIIEPGWLEAILETFDRYDATWVFGASEPEWPGAAPSWYSARVQNYFAVLDYGSEPFVVTDGDHPFYGLNFAGMRAAHVTLNGFRTEFGFRGDKGGVGEDIDMFDRALGAGMRIVYTPRARVRHMIPPARVGKHYHRRRQWLAVPVYYQHLPEMFPRAAWLLGLPRFFYLNAAKSALGYARALVERDRAARFDHEMQLVKFARLSAEAARHGFRKRSSAPSQRQSTSPGTVQS